MAVAEPDFELIAGERNRIDNEWQFLNYRAINNHSHKRYKNNLVTGLYLVECLVSYPESYYRAFWCDMGQSSHAMNSESAFDNFMEGKDFNISPSAGGKILAWREEEEEPEPPPPPPPPPEEDGGIFDGWLDTIKEWIHQAVIAGLAFLEEPLNIIRRLIGSLAQTISNIVSAIQSAIATVIAEMASIFDTIIGKIKGVIDAVWENIQLVWLTLKDMFNTVKSAILIAFEKSWIFIKETFTTLWDKIKSGLTYIGDQIVKGLKYLWDKIKDALNWTWNILKSAYDSILDVAKGIWDRFKERLTETIDSIKEAFGDVVDKLIVWWENYMDWRDKNREALDTWTEEKMIDAIKFMVRTQKTVIEELAKEFK